MKSIASLLALAALLPSRALVDAELQTACTFTINSSGPLSYVVGQHEDGTFRLSGTASPSPFSINSGGGVRDSRGFGCIVTEPPHTQIRCDQNGEPDPGLSLDASHQLLYQGSSHFWACPVAESEYNVYTDPNAEQADCVSVVLTASGCGSPEIPICDLPSSAWQTQTVTADTVETVTVVVTETPSVCAAPAGDIAESGLPPGLPEDAQNAPHHLSKRAHDLDTLWREVRQNTNGGHVDRNRDHWVSIDRHRRFWLTPRQSIRIGTDYLYGCTVWMVVGPRAILFGHARQGDDMPFESYHSTKTTIIPSIEDMLEPAYAGNAATEACHRHAWIMGTVRDEPTTGAQAMREFLEFDGVPENQIRYLRYEAGAVLFPNNPQTGPRGKGVVTVDAAADGTAVLKVFLSSDQPRMTLNLRNVTEGGQEVYTISEVTTSTSSETT